MGFSPSLAGVIAVLASVLGAASASADAVPGPPFPVSAADRAGAFCALRESSMGDAAGFAAGVAITAIAARRRQGWRA